MIDNFIVSWKKLFYTNFIVLFIMIYIILSIAFTQAKQKNKKSRKYY